MATKTRGNVLSQVPGKGRGSCPLCSRTRIKLLYEGVTVDGASGEGVQILPSEKTAYAGKGRLTMAKYYRTRQAASEVNIVETPVWTCSNRNCKCWLRDEFSFSQNPVCPLCKSGMVKNSKKLPEIQKERQRL